MFRLISTLGGLLFAVGCLNAQFLGLTSEVYATSEYGTTYRVHAQFEIETAEIIAHIQLAFTS